MKTIKLVLSYIGLLFLLYNPIYSQYATCTPDPTVTDPEGVGVRSPIDLPVGFINEYYSTVLTIIAPEKATTWGFLDFTITKIQLTEMVNMPNGLIWETNSENSDDYMYASEKYCMIVEGTPNDIPGIREVDVYANAWIKVIIETSAPGNPQNGGSVTYTLCNQTSVDLGSNRTMTTDDEIILSADQGTDFHTYLWSDNSTQPELNICGNELGVGVHQVSVMVFDTVGTTGIYSDREPVCYKEDNIQITVIEGNSVEQNMFDEFSIFPNPCKGEFYINSNSPVNIEIYDLNGKIVFSQFFDEPQIKLNLTHLANGIYLIKSECKGQIKTDKLKIAHDYFK